MIASDWHYVPVPLRSAQVAEVCCKLELTHDRRRGWHLQAVLVDGEEHVPADGGQTDIGRAIAAAATTYFEAYRSDILTRNGLTDQEC